MTITPKKGSPPIDKFKIGRVNCSIWCNGDGGHLNATYSVSYKKDDNSWSETNSFGRNDLPALVCAASMALQRMMDLEKGES